MGQYVSVLIIGMLTAIFTSLITYIITLAFQRGNINRSLEEAFKIHTQIHHKKDISVSIDLAKREVKEQLGKEIEAVKTSVVEANKEIHDLTKITHQTTVALAKLTTSQSWIIERLKGNPEDFGL